MGDLTQANRPMSVDTPLGADKLLLEKFRGTEAVSEPFRFYLDVVSPGDTPVEFDKILGQSITVSLMLESGDKRHFNGICRRFVETGMVRGPHMDNPVITYQAELVPEAWTLTRQVNSRLWQEKSVKDILEEVLQGVTTSFKLQTTYEPRDYCVQYRETDFEFISRLMEEEGIFYFFQHDDGSHTMVIADDKSAHEDISEPAKVIYRRPGDDAEESAESQYRIQIWRKAQELRSGKTTLWDHKFEMTGKNFEASETILPDAQAGTISHKLEVAGNSDWERYDFPGRFAKRFDGITPAGSEQSDKLGKISEDNTRTAKIRQEQETAPSIRVTGVGNVRTFMAGSKFKLASHFDANGDWMLTRVEHRATLEGAYTGSRGAVPFRYANAFECMPDAIPFRPQMVQPRPIIEGPQTATVVGTEGKEIFTDKYGRVKVQFHWDREGQEDEKTSCWLRVATLWAGKQWGSVFLPRVGQEVVVAFLDGDPDRPLVVGSVYNDQQMPPYELPDNETISGIKSNSSTGGEGFNEIRFQDKADEEEIYVHAQKDYNVVVENDKNTHILNDMQLHVVNDRKELIDNDNDVHIGNDHKELVSNDFHLHVANDYLELIDNDYHQHVKNDSKELIDNDFDQAIKGDKKVKIDGDQSFEVGGDNKQKTGGDDTVSVGGESVVDASGNITLKSGGTIILDAPTIVLKGSSGVTLVVGGNFVKVSSAGVDIQGSMTKINSGGSPDQGNAGSAGDPVSPADPTDATDAVDAEMPEIDPEATTGYKSCD